MKLAKLQRWIQAVVVHPGTTAQALKSRPASALLKGRPIESVLRPSPTLTAAQRVAVYQEMFPMRMRDALASDYPGLEHFLGDRFWDFVVAYTQTHPSVSYTLNRLGSHVPGFIRRQRTFGPRAFLADLAALELAITEAFDAPQSERLKAEDLENLPPERLASGHLQVVPSFRLVQLEWNADEYLDTLRDEQHRHPKPRRRKAHVAVVRRNYNVYRVPLSEAAFRMLQDIQTGISVGEVVARALRRRGTARVSPEDFANNFKNWTSEGFFAGFASTRRRRARKRA